MTTDTQFKKEIQDRKKDYEEKKVELISRSIRDYKNKAGMMQLVNVLSLRIDRVKYRYGKEYSPLDIF